jgi:hypothetical protein
MENDYGLMMDKRFISSAHRKRLHIYVGFGLGDKLLAHSLVNVELTNVHKMKIFTWL